MNKKFLTGFRGIHGIAFVVTTAIALSACGSDNSRSTALAHLADQTIIPTYQQVATKAHDFDEATKALCQSPTAENSATALKAIEAMRTSWKKSEAVWIGPVMTSRSWALIDYPISQGDIDAVIGNASLTQLDVDTIGKRVGADERGLQAADYLVKGGNLSDARRCDYLKAIAQTILNESNKVLSHWTEKTGDQAPYRDAFIDDDKSMSLDSLINDQISILNKIGETEFGQPGNMDRLEGVHSVLVGDEQHPGISELLGSELKNRIKAAIDAAKTAPPDQQEQKLEALKNIIGTEVVARLGVAIGFSDTDGDSAK